MVRPTALTPERQERLCQAIRAGAPPETAAVYAGIGKSTCVCPRGVSAPPPA